MLWNLYMHVLALSISFKACWITRVDTLTQWRQWASCLSSDHALPPRSWWIPGFKVQTSTKLWCHEVQYIHTTQSTLYRYIWCKISCQALRCLAIALLSLILLLILCVCHTRTRTYIISLPDSPSQLGWRGTLSLRERRDRGQRCKRQGEECPTRWMSWWDDSRNWSLERIC